MTRPRTTDNPLPHAPVAGASGGNILCARSDQDVFDWLTDRAAELTTRGVPRQSWVAKSLHLLEAEIKSEVRARAALRKTQAEEWAWYQFATVLLDVVENIRAQPEEKVIERMNHPTKEQSSFTRFRAEHPIAAVATGVGLAIATPILAPIVMVGALNAVGFGAAGVAAGSIAAGIQSIFYGGAVASGSAFAIAQSIGAGGAALAVAAPLVSAGGAAVGLAGASQFMPRNDSDGGEQPESKAERVSTEKHVSNKAQQAFKERASKERPGPKAQEMSKEEMVSKHSEITHKEEYPPPASPQSRSRTGQGNNKCVCKICYRRRPTGITDEEREANLAMARSLREMSSTPPPTP
ncbi:hypothetical protein C8F01DRAFT_1369187 [Mycena amicta]|nr:hypothetical protein C8F01DRAFT_1369187 [Mycena amicta]